MRTPTIPSAARKRTRASSDMMVPQRTPELQIAFHPAQSMDRRATVIVLFVGDSGFLWAFLLSARLPLALTPAGRTGVRNRKRRRNLVQAPCGVLRRQLQKAL